jgi:hypothetical protein
MVRLIQCDELEGIRKETVLVYFKILSRNSTGGTKKKDEKRQNSRSSDRDSGRGPSEYEERALRCATLHLAVWAINFSSEKSMSLNQWQTY